MILIKNIFLYYLNDKKIKFLYKLHVNLVEFHKDFF